MTEPVRIAQKLIYNLNSLFERDIDDHHLEVEIFCGSYKYLFNIFPFLSLPYSQATSEYTSLIMLNETGLYEHWRKVLIEVNHLKC